MSEIAPLLVVRDSDPVIRHLEAHLAAAEAAVATLRQALGRIRAEATTTAYTVRGWQPEAVKEIFDIADAALAAVPAPAAPEEPA